MSNYVFGVCSDDYFPTGCVPVPEFNAAVETDEQAELITKALFHAAREMRKLENGNRPDARYVEAWPLKNGRREADFYFSSEELDGVQVEAYLSFDGRAWNYVIFAAAAAGKMQGIISGCISWSPETVRSFNELFSNN